jgi:hypothetical protein
MWPFEGRGRQLNRDVTADQMNPADPAAAAMAAGRVLKPIDRHLEARVNCALRDDSLEPETRTLDPPGEVSGL